jgi:UPF0042 nucleotide-binding protein
MSEKQQPHIEIVIITGLSGSGKTIALRSLEDMGFFCIDNLPAKLLDIFLSSMDLNVSRIGIGVDVREGEYLSDMYTLLSFLKDKYKVQILFLEANRDVLVRRYKETRRPHPVMALKGAAKLEDAISEEEKILFPIRDAADKIIDTSHYSPHQLREFISLLYGKKHTSSGLSVLLITFGYKYGIPQNIDLLFDVRFLPNPYFVPELKPLKGTEKAVSDFVLSRSETTDFLRHLSALLDFLIPNYIREGRSYLVIGIGCTGGQHRSPVIAEEIASHIIQSHNIKPEIVHRDIG